MRYNYSTSFKAYKLAVRTYIRSSPRRRLRFHFYMWGLALIGFVLGIVMLGLHNQFPNFSNAVLPLAAGAIAGGMTMPILRPWQQKRCFMAWEGEALNHSVFVEREGPLLISGIEGCSESRFQRSAVCETAEDENMLLLFLNKKKFLYFSKSLVPPAAMDEIRMWLQVTGAADKC